MNKELIKLLSHLLDKSDPNWAQNPELIDAMNKLHERKTFAPPTLQEVIDELARQKVFNHVVQATKFWNFYEAKNWMIGKNKMKSWKAAIKTWNFEKNNIIL